MSQYKGDLKMHKSIILAFLYIKLYLFFNYSLSFNYGYVNCSRLLKLKYTKKNEYVVLNKIDDKFKLKLKTIENNKPGSEYLIHIENRMLYYKIQGERIDIIQKTNSDRAEGWKMNENTGKKRVLFLKRYDSQPDAHHFYSKPKRIESMDTTGVSKLLQGFETTSPFIKTDDQNISSLKRSFQDTNIKGFLDNKKQIDKQEVEETRITPLKKQLNRTSEDIKTNKQPNHMEYDMREYNMAMKQNIKEKDIRNESSYKNVINHSLESKYPFIDLASDSEVPEFIIKGVFINPIASNTFQLSNMERRTTYKKDMTRIPVCLTFIPGGNNKHKAKKTEDMFIFSPCTKTKNQLFEVKIIDDLVETDDESTSSNHSDEESASSYVDHRHVKNRHSKGKPVRKVKTKRFSNKKETFENKGVTNSEMDLIKKMKLFKESSSMGGSDDIIYGSSDNTTMNTGQNIREKWMKSEVKNKGQKENRKSLNKDPQTQAVINTDPFEAMISQLNSSFDNSNLKDFKI